MACNKEESISRLQTIYKMYSAGTPSKEIVEYCREKYNINQAQVYRYLNKCLSKIKTELTSDIDFLRKESNDFYRHQIEALTSRVYEKDSDFISAQKVIKDIRARIDRINALEVETVRHEGSVNIQIDASFIGEKVNEKLKP